MESLPILLSDLVRVHPGRPEALPTATGWDEELRARTAGVRLPRPGHSESSFRTDPFVCPIMLCHIKCVRYVTIIPMFRYRKIVQL